MIATAVTIDILQGFLALMIIGLVLNTIIGIFAWIIFFVWSKILGVNFLDRGGQKAIVYFGGGVLEFIPLLNILPAWTLTIVLTTLIVQWEDKQYNDGVRKKMKKLEKALV